MSAVDHEVPGGPGTIPGPLLKAWSASLLESWGYRISDADYVAESLIEANLRGIDSHGVARLPIYRRRIKEGLVDPRAVPVVVTDDAVIRVDAAGAPGQLAARAATTALASVAGRFGVATAVVRGSSHFGTAGHYARSLAAHGLVALVVSNSEPIVVPFGGSRALLGTNPLAFAAPGPDWPISLDMATSTSAMGKVDLARSLGKSVPGDWGVDSAGRSTTDASQVVALLPAAGPKGYGLAFMVEILGGVLAGAAVGHEIGNMYRDFDRPQNVGHWMMAIDVKRLLPLVDFTDRIGDLIGMAHATEPAPGAAGVLVPGEPEERIKTDRTVSGIPLAPATIAELTELGERCAVAFPGTATDHRV